MYFGSQDCGGSIISKNYVLTAAHCIALTDPKYLRVRSGSSYKDRGGTIHRVVKTITHDNITYIDKDVSYLENDIGLIKVCEPFEYDISTKSIGLVNKEYEFKVGEICTISGWGFTETKCQPDVLMAVDVPIVNKTLCNEAYKQYGGIHENEFCAGYYGKGGKDACSGDSGGPLVIDGKQAGVISRGNECGLPSFPGIYVDISQYYDWIVKNSDL